MNVFTHKMLKFSLFYFSSQSAEESWMLPQELSPPPITPTCTPTAGCVAGSWWWHPAAGSRSASMTCGWRILGLPVHMTTLRWVLLCQYSLTFHHFSFPRWARLVGHHRSCSSNELLGLGCYAFVRLFRFVHNTWLPIGGTIENGKYLGESLVKKNK